MKPLKHRLLWVLTPLFLAGALSCVLAEVPPNPYRALAERNAFGLKPAPLVVKTPLLGSAIPPKVVLTGIVSVFGQSRALLEITEHRVAEIGKPILREGERWGPVEVVSIDDHNSTVKVRINGAETTLFFAQAKPTANTGAAPLPEVLSP